MNTLKTFGPILMLGCICIAGCDTKSKNAMVYVEGGYLGLIQKHKTFDLRPGNHDIELRDAAGTVLLHQRIAIVPGGTTRIDAMGVAG